jgi:hypothetical protein
MFKKLFRKNKKQEVSFETKKFILQSLVAGFYAEVQRKEGQFADINPLSLAYSQIKEWERQNKINSEYDKYLAIAGGR